MADIVWSFLFPFFILGATTVGHIPWTCPYHKRIHETGSTCFLSQFVGIQILWRKQMVSIYILLLMQVIELKPEWLIEIAPHFYQMKDVEDGSNTFFVFSWAYVFICCFTIYSSVNCWIMIHCSSCHKEIASRERKGCGLNNHSWVAYHSTKRGTQTSFSDGFPASLFGSPSHMLQENNSWCFHLIEAIIQPPIYGCILVCCT